MVAWIRFLLEAADETSQADPQNNAELAFHAEVAEFNEPGGKMDHYASAYGGVISLHFAEQIRVRSYPNQLGDFVLADGTVPMTGNLVTPEATADIHTPTWGQVKAYVDALLNP